MSRPLEYDVLGMTWKAGAVDRQRFAFYFGNEENLMVARTCPGSPSCLMAELRLKSLLKDYLNISLLEIK